MSLWADSGNSGATFGSIRKGPAHLESVERLKEALAASDGIACACC